MFKIEQVRDLAREAVAELDPARLDGRDAARLAEAAAESAKLLDTANRNPRQARRRHQRVAEPIPRSEPGAMARRDHRHLGGSRTRDLRDRDPARPTCPRPRSSSDRVELSLQQAAHVTAGAAADPSSERRLLATARRSGMRELRAERERVIAAACDEVEARRRAKRERHLRTFTEGFATRGTFSGPTEEVAKLLHALEPLEQARFEAARRSGEHEAREAYRFDAMIDLAEVTHRDEPKPQPQPGGPGRPRVAPRRPHPTR